MMKIQRLTTAQEFTQVIQLLAESKLPYEDLDQMRATILVAVESNEVIGAGALEVYEESGLIRSICVAPAHRKKSIATRITESLLHIAREQKLKSLILLTETAATYFEKRGFKVVGRGDVPGPVRQSSEFSHVCPSSAVVMSYSFTP